MVCYACRVQSSVPASTDAGHPIRALLRACDALRRGHFAAAAAEIDWVLGRSRDPDLRLPAARLAACLGHYDRALRELLNVADDHPHRARAALEAALGLTLRVGWDQDTRRVLERTFGSPEASAGFHRAAVRLYGRRAPEHAIDHARRSLALNGAQPAVRLELAALAAEVGDLETARVEARRALARIGTRPYVLEAAHIFFDLADVEASRGLLTALLETDPSDTEAQLFLARVELAAGDRDEARRLARRILDEDPDDPGALGVLGALALLGDRVSEAMALLNRSLELDPSSGEVFAWRAEAQLALGNRETCRDDAHLASMLGGHPVPARLLHLLASTGPGDPAPRVYEMRLENVRGAILELCPDAAADLDSELHERVVPVLWRAFRRLGSNRTASPTWIDDAGRVRRLSARGGVRSACRAALERIRCQPPELVYPRLDELVARYRESSLPLCHRGELAMWLGDVERARADFEAAIRLRSETRFAYIGLAGCALLEEDPERALAECDRGIEVMHGTHGPAVFAYRGEALHRLGRLDEAARDLERACRESPTRIGSRIALAIVRAEQDADSLAKTYEEIASIAPALVSDAADGIVPVSHRATAPPTQQLAVLGRALGMLRGNRSSSCYTYFSHRGELRSIPGHGAGQRDPHARDAAELERIETALTQRLARDSRRPSVSHGASHVEGSEPPVPRLLDDAAIERFLRDGYVALRGAIARETCEKLIDRLHVRLTTAPERWVRRADADTLAALLRLEPGDPASWPAARLDVEGERAIPISELSPSVWRAVCQLLGGPERVETRAFFDAFVLNLRDLAEREWTPPTAAQDSWHYDDPGDRDTLQDFRRGLIAIIYLSDVEPRCGGTFVAPESVPLTIRWMAENPAGVDLVTRSSGPRIAASCTRFDELVGKAGDVFLLHPLMLHSSSANTSGRVRYMTNPMVYLRQPLRFDGDPARHASPLEESFRRALGLA